MSTNGEIPEIILRTRAAASGVTGESVEPRQILQDEERAPDPSKSIPLPPNRQRLVDDVMALYACEPTIERVCRYAPACVYDDQFVYANDRYKMAAQWYGLAKLFPKSECMGLQIVRNDPTLIQWKYQQRWFFHGVSKTVEPYAFVSLVLDEATKDSDFPLVLYHKDQGNQKDYSHQGIGFWFKKLQADNVPKLLSQPEVELFKGDAGAAKEAVKTYGSGKNAPKSEVA